MAFTPSGVEFVAKGINRYLSDLGRADKAQQGLGKSAGKLSQIASRTGSDFVGLGNNILSLGKTAGLVAAGGVAALGAVLATFAIGGIKQAKDLDQQMADIAAVMGKTKDAVTPLKEEILALSIDPQLRVNATQAADAVEILAKNGLDMAQILDGAAKSTIALANATKADFSVAGDIATDVMNVFNIKASDMGTAIDGITGVVNNSKLDINDYALALSSAGAVAQGMGVDLTDFNTVLAATASSFSSGRVAGTSLKVLLQRLADPTDEMKAAMEKYGISLFDSEGNMRKMSEIAQQLNNVFQGTATITQTVGGVTKEQAQAAENAAKKIDSLRGSISTNTQKLQLMNDELVLQKQYYGEGSPVVRKRQIQIEELSNKIEEQRRQLGEYETAIKLVDGAQAKQVTSTKTLTEAEKAQLAATLGGADGARQILALSKLTGDEFDKLSGKVNDQGQALRAAATRVDSLQGAWDIFKSILQSLQIQIGDKFIPLLRRIAVWLTDLSTKYGPKVVGFFGKIADGIGGFIQKIKDLITTFQAGGLFGSRAGSFGSQGLLAALGLSPEIIGIVQNTLNRISELITEFQAGGLFGARAGSFGGQGLLVALGLDSSTVALVEATINTIINLISSISFDELLGALTGIGVVLAGGVFAAIVAGLLALLTPINLIIAGAALLGAAWAGNWGNIQGITMSVVGGITSFISDNWATIQAVFLTSLAVIQSVWAGIIAGLQPAFAAFAQIGEAVSSLGITWSDVWNALLQATGIVASAIGALLLGIISIVVGLVSGIASGIAQIIQTFQTLTGFLTQFVTGVLQLFQGNFSEGLQNILQGLLGTILTLFTGGLAAVIAVIIGFVEGVVGFWEGLYETLVGGSIVTDLINRIIELFTALPEAISSALGSLADIVSNIFSSLFGGADTGQVFDTQALASGFATVLDNIQQVQELITILTTETIPLLTQAFILAIQTYVIQLQLLMQQVMALNQLFITMTQITIPNLRVAAIEATQAMISGFTATIAVVQQLIAVLGTLIEKFKELSKTVAEEMGKVVDAISEAVKKIKTDLIPAINDATEAFKKMAEAAREAAKAARDAGNASAEGGGPGFQAGTGGIRTVPAGVGTFPITLHPREEFAVAPPGMNLLEMLGARGGGDTIINIPITVGAINNGMDVANLQSLIRRTVSESIKK